MAKLPDDIEQHAQVIPGQTLAIGPGDLAATLRDAANIVDMLETTRDIVTVVAYQEDAHDPRNPLARRWWVVMDVST